MEPRLDFSQAYCMVDRMTHSDQEGQIELNDFNKGMVLAMATAVHELRDHTIQGHLIEAVPQLLELAAKVENTLRDRNYILENHRIEHWSVGTHLRYNNPLVNSCLKRLEGCRLEQEVDPITVDDKQIVEWKDQAIRSFFSVAGNGGLTSAEGVKLVLEGPPYSDDTPIYDLASLEEDVELPWTHPGISRLLTTMADPVSDAPLALIVRVQDHQYGFYSSPKDDVFYFFNPNWKGSTEKFEPQLWKFPKQDPKLLSGFVKVLTNHLLPRDPEDVMKAKITLVCLSSVTQTCQPQDAGSLGSLPPLDDEKWVVVFEDSQAG